MLNTLSHLIARFCNTFTNDQRQQLVTPSYRLKREKREAKKLEAPPAQDNDELVDPANVSVIGAVDNRGSVKSPVSAPPPDKKPKKDTKKEKSPSSKASKSQSQASADVKIAELDSKWSECFNCLEALIMAKNFEPTFSANVKVTPTHSPPSTIEKVSEPFIRPSTPSTLPASGFSAEKHQPTSKAVTSRQTFSTKFPVTGSSASKHQPASQTKTRRATSATKFAGQGSSAMHQPASQTKANRPTPAVDTSTDPSTQIQSTGKHEAHQPHLDRPSATDRPLSSEPADTGSPALHRSRRESISSLSSDAGSVLSDRPALDLYTEEGELSEDPDQTVVDQDQPVSEEQNYRETMQGICSYMG